LSQAVALLLVSGDNPELVIRKGHHIIEKKCLQEKYRPTTDAQRPFITLLVMKHIEEKKDPCIYIYIYIYNGNMRYWHLFSVDFNHVNPGLMLYGTT